jgi:CBS domain-containing protein
MGFDLHLKLKFKMTTPPAHERHLNLSPSSSLFGNFRKELAEHVPFAQMAHADLDFFLSNASQHYYAPEDVLIEPASGIVTQLFFIRRGAVTGTRGLPGPMSDIFEYEAGDLLPLNAAMAGRPVTAVYRASADTFVLTLPVLAMQTLVQQSPAFADFLNQHTQQLLALSRQALLASYASQALTEQQLEKPLEACLHRSPVSCPPETHLREALKVMHQARIGAMLVTDPMGQALGILTRFDILGRITLAQVSLDAPISQVMTQPVLTLTTAHTAEDAALLMSRHGMRHVPITRHGAAVGMVSERDLFAMQKQSLKSVSSSLRAATDSASLIQAAAGIRRLTHSLLGQGVQARQLTAMISHLNDVLTEKLLALKAEEHGIDMRRLCWLALGSEGRDEQTIATDQDNALILPNDTTEAQRAKTLAFARDVNLVLDACGYPLCRGGVMAGEPACCLTWNEWRARFEQWVRQGTPEDLLNASIYFDFRYLSGDAMLAQSLRQEVVQAAQQIPRFLKQMALNALTRGVALNWRGAIDTDTNGALDLKLQGAAIFVDVARIYSLAHGLAQTNTRQRLEAAGQHMALAENEYGAWVSGFEFLQMLRLRIQLQGGPALAQPNRLVIAELNDIDRRILRETLRVARQLQQRLQLDYQR